MTAAGGAGAAPASHGGECAVRDEIPVPGRRVAGDAGPPPAKPVAVALPQRAGRGMVLAALATVYVVWGSTYLGIRVAIDTMPPLLMAGVRFLLAGAMLYGFCRWRYRRDWQSLEWLHWRSAAIVGIALLGLGNGGVTVGEQYVPSGIAALLVATVPLWMAVFGTIFSRVRLSRVAAVGIVLGLLGTALLLRPGSGTDPLRMLAVLVSPLCWAAGSLYSRTAALPRRPLVSTSMEMLCGGAALVVVGALAGEGRRVNLGAVSLHSALALLYLIIFGSLLAYSAYVWLLKNASSTLVSTYAYVNPVVAVALGWAFLAERVTAWTLVASGVIAVSVALIVARPEARRKGGNVRRSGAEVTDDHADEQERTGVA